MSNDPQEVRRARSELAGLFTYGRKPDPEVEAAARCKLTTVKLARAIREASEVTPPLHSAQVEYLTGLIAGLGISE